MSKYTAQDFANARFAEHPDGRVAARCDPSDPDRPWSMGEVWYSDASMARDGWVPVPTKPTITESRLDEVRDLYFDRGLTIQGMFEAAGFEIVPDPEPTNTDRLAELIADYYDDAADAETSLQQYLNDHGVTAPNVKDN